PSGGGSRWLLSVLDSEASVFPEECVRASTHSRGSSMQREREGQICQAGSLMRGPMPGPWDHNLSRRQTLND
ncbi:unnamed protein product, partial [Gulo gulo]